MIQQEHPDPTAIIKRIVVGPRVKIVEVYCPICPKVHFHGWGDDSQPDGIPGHRGKHCSNPYRDHDDEVPGGYYIPKPNRYTKIVRRK